MKNDLPIVLAVLGALPSMLATAFDFSGLNGAYDIITWDNGTTSIKPAGAPDVKFLSIEADEWEEGGDPSSLEKRFTDCWGTPLQHDDTDWTTECLRNWAGSGTELCSPAGATYQYWCVANNVKTYACINARSRCGNFDRNDVNYALSQMDAICGIYTASYYQWDSPEIVGKALAGTPVCVG